MTKGAPGRGGGKRHKPCHAGGCGGGEEGVDVFNRLSVARADGKCQKKASQKYGYYEAD